MFKPYEFWKMETLHLKGAKISEEKLTSMKEEYAKLDEKALLRFIKSAEQSYDYAVDSLKHNKPFGTFLTEKELRTLLIDYGLPQQLYKGPKDVLMKAKKINEKNIENQWKNLKDEEKKKYQLEFEKSNKQNLEKQFYFARNLPESRIQDYLIYINNYELTSPSKIPTKAINRSDYEEIKQFRSKHGPHEIFYEETKDTYDSHTLFLKKAEGRTKYSHLSNEEKLIYIKKCESAFDKYMFTSSDNDKPCLFHVLSKSDLKILLESYGQPKSKPAQNLSAYYFSIHAGDYEENHMKNVFSEFKKISEEDKVKLNQRYLLCCEEYKKQYKEFLEKLPVQRHVDLEKLENKEINKDKNEVDKTKSKAKSTAAKKKLVESNALTQESTPSTQSSAPEIDFDELDKRVEKAKALSQKDKLIEQLREGYDYVDNAFSCFVNEKLKSQKKMNMEESVNFIKKEAEEWLNLDDLTKETYENKYKKTKKEFKKGFKKILESFENNLELEIDEAKTILKDKARKIDIKLDETTVEELVLTSKALENILDSSITSVETDSKKPKTVVNNELEKSPRKRKNSESSSKKSKKSKTITIQ